MPVWKLTPIDTNDPCWEMSTWKHFVVVKAPTEDQARMHAMRAFAIAAKVMQGEKVRFVPWNSPEHVKAEKIVAKHSGYNTAGLKHIEILDPPHGEDEIL